MAMEDLLDEQERNNNHGNNWREGDPLETILRGYQFDFSKFFEIGWKAFSKDIGWYILYALVFLILAVISVFTIVGWIFVLMPLTAGFVMYAKKAYLDEERSFETFFEGFKFIWPLLGVFGLTILTGIILYIPILIFAGASIFESISYGVDDPFFMQNALGGNLAIQSYQYVANFVSQALLFLSIPLVVFGKLKGWDAFTWSIRLCFQKFGWFLLVAIVTYIITMVGALFCGIGILFTLPLAEALRFGLYYHIVGLGDKSTPEVEEAGYAK